MLSRALQDGPTGVKAGAAAGLGFLGSAGAVPPLEDALEDDDRPVVKAAYAALGQIEVGSTREAPEVGT